MPSFEDIRSRYPGARDLTDEQIIERTAEITKLPLSVVADDFGYTPRTRNPAAFANDTVIGTLNSAIGGASAIGDFFVPGNVVSQDLKKFVDETGKNQSLPVRLENEKLSQALSTDDLGTQVSGVKDYVLRNPIQAAGQAIGSFAIPFGAIKGFRAGAEALDLGAKAVTRAGTAGGVTAGAVLGGGDAAGDAYDMVYNSPKLANLSPEERDEIATAAARKAQVVPTLIGGASGLFGADKALAAGGTRSILKTAGAEFLSEAVEEGTTKLSANLAAGQVDSDIKPLTGVAGSALLGGILGGGTGLAVGAMTKERPANSFLGGANNTDGSVDDTAINRAIDGNSQPLPVGPIPRSAAYGPNIPEQAGPPAPQVIAGDQAQIQVQQDQQLQLDAAAKQEEQRAARSEVFRKYGGVETTIPNGTKPMWQYLGKNYFTLESLGKAVDAQVEKESQKPPLVREVENALTQTYEAVGAKPYTPGKMTSFLTPFTEQAESLEEVAGRIEAEILNSKENTPQSDTLKALRNIILGKPVGEAFGDANPAPADVATNNAEPVQQLLTTPPAKTTTPDATQPSQWTDVTQQYLAEQAAQQQGATNEPQQQLQDPAGLGDVPVQGRTDQGSGAVTGDVRTEQVRPLGTGSNSLLADTQQDVELGAEGTRPVVSESGISAADARNERQEALAQVRRILAEVLGSERDASIMMELQDDSDFKSQEAIAEKYGVSQETVSRKKTLMNSGTLGPRFLLAAKKLGISKADIAYLMATIEGTKLDQDQQPETELVNDVESFIDQEQTETTASDDENVRTSDDAELSNLTEEEEFDLNEIKDPTKGGYGIIRSVAGTKQADASATNKTAPKYKRFGTQWDKYKDFELQNLIADDIISDDDLESLVKEINRREEVRVAAKAPAAKKDTKVTTKKAEPKVEAKVETKVAKPAKEQVIKPGPEVTAATPAVQNATQKEKAAFAWDRGVKDFPQAPKFAELTAEQQRTWVSFGEDNWTKEDVKTELAKLAKESATGKAQFSRKESSGETWSQDGLTTLLKQMFVANKNFDNLITVVSTYDELPAYVRNAVKKSSAIQAFVYGKRVYMIADQIEVSQELPVFLHEVGVHLGMENLLGTVNYRKLAGQVMNWSTEKGSSVEHEVAKAAKKRVDDAVAEAKKNGETLSSNEQLDELLAYFVEEAVARGIDPTATKVASSQIGQWFRTLMAALKVGLRKIGFGKFDQLSAGNIVDLAFGAAKLEISGAYHGTAADFRKFKTKLIGTGEGAVAYGWGLYMAERFGIALDYMRSDVKRKAEGEGYSYKGRNKKHLRREEMKNLGFSTENKVALDVIRQYERLRDDFGVPAPIEDVIKFEIEQNQKRIDNNEVGTRSGFIQKTIDALKALDPADFTDAVKKPGNVMRVLPMADEDSLMDLDVILEKQPEVLRKIKDGFPAQLLEDIDEESNLTLEDMTGRDLQNVLTDLEDQGVTDLFFQLPDEIIDTIKQGRFMSKQIVSEYLKLKLGIEGVKYFDASSRNIGNQVSVARLPEIQAIKFTALGIPFTPRYASIRSNDVIIKGSVGDLKNAQVRLSDYVSNDELMAVIDHIKDEQDRQTKNVVMFSDRGVSRVATFERAAIGGKVQYSLNTARKETQTRIDRMPKAYRGTMQKMFDFLTTKKLTDRTLAAFAFTRDVTERAFSAGLKSARTYQRLSDARKQILGSYASKLETIIEDFNKLDATLAGTGPNSVNRFLKDSTVEGKWGFQPTWLPKQVTVDPVMQERFEALEKASPKAAEIIKSVFKYNYDTNQAMKKSILESITSEFDALIVQAKKDGDVVEEARLTKEKSKDLSEFATRLAIRNEKPYAPLKRFGNIVVVGKSQAYMDAEDANDQAEIRKLQTNENHYVVRFAETNSEAQQIYRDMQGKYEYLTEPFDSADAESSVYGGSDINGLFYRLRNLVEKDSLDDPVQRGMTRMLNSLHLKLLSEESVRKSENQRKNITGADDDMMRAFVSQGRAAAHFVSSLTNSAGIYESMREMRKERDARTPGKDVRSIYYNEIMKRHGMELNYDPTPIVDAALNVTSTWMLLTSPGYFFQNATQPFLLSLPYMGSNPKFGYTRTANELLKTYGEVKKVVGLGKKGLSEGDYKDLPEDVRGAIEELVNRGSINISLSAELGRFRSEVGADEDIAQKGAALYTKGTDMLRGFAENLESINRLTTAMTAYRMALRSGMSNEASIDYADKVIYNTHGDYSGTNAPRLMRTGAGRVATQFRKFQLIQISLMARLWHEWRKGATPEERIVAKRQLMFTLGHTFAVGGIMGMPGFTALAFLWGALFGDEDEPDNPELTLRRLIGNDDLADLLVKGVPAFMGVDLSGKLGMGQMLSILPYTDFKLTRESMNQATVALIGGPFLGGLVPKAVDGAAYMAAGEYYKGLEKLLPKGLGDAMKGLRIANEGLTNKRGDLQLSADEITFMDSFLAGLGLPTTTLTDRQFAESTKFQFDEFYNGKTTEIKNAYAKAYRAGDAQGMAEARQKWMDIQQSRVKNGYSRQPLSTLIKAPVEQRKREMNSAGGVGFDRGNRRFVQEITRD